MPLRVIVHGLGAILLWTAATTSVDAAGYWNLPSSFCQCMGYGCGAGYHAPLVLGPVSCDGWLATNERRLPHAYSPPGAGCVYGNGYEFAEPTIMEPMHFVPPQPPVAPILPPTSQRHRPLFLQ